MFVLRDKRTGKYLKSFSGSFDRAWSRAFDRVWRIREAKGGVGIGEVYDAMFCLPTPVGAKVYATKGGVSASLGTRRRLAVPKVVTRRGFTYNEYYEAIPLSESHPWLEVLPVTSIAVSEK